MDPIARGRLAPPPLYGLVLAGGRSTRMRRDKAALAYQGRTQLERAMALLTAHVSRAFVSGRPEQGGDAVRPRFALIQDAHENIGPVVGLLAAQAHYLEAARLAVVWRL